jgi:hypothetical protein
VLSNFKGQEKIGPAGQVERDAEVSGKESPRVKEEQLLRNVLPVNASDILDSMLLEYS